MIVTTLSSNTSTDALTQHSGTFWAHVAGTFGGGTCTLEYQTPGGGTWYAIEGGAFTSGPISRVVQLPGNCPVRATLSGATTPSVAVHLQRI